MVDVSLGRYGRGPKRPTLVQVQEGWWRLEWFLLAVEVDDQGMPWSLVFLVKAALSTSVLAFLYGRV